MNIKYPVYKPALLGNEKKYVIDCLESTWISSKGKYLNEFEKSFAGFVSVKYATDICNET
jgi:perosamine synthetase